MVEEAVTIEWDSNHARSQDRSVDSQNERAHMSILTSVVRVIQSLPPLAPFKPWQIEIVLAFTLCFTYLLTVVACYTKVKTRNDATLALSYRTGVVFLGKSVLAFDEEQQHLIRTNRA